MTYNHLGKETVAELNQLSKAQLIKIIDKYQDGDIDEWDLHYIAERMLKSKKKDRKPLSP